VKSYSEDYYAGTWVEGSRSSAEVVVPLLYELVQPLRSVVDVGCGTGEWLAVFDKHGAEDICGVDGDWVNRGTLQFPQEHFVPHDLTRPFSMARGFDLVVSLEVAEHLPAGCAETFVRSLVGLGSVVLFSAAIPGQRGHHHINLRWQDYWAKLFDREGYAAVDCIRNKIWNDQRVCYWYAQNTILYVDRERLESEPLLKREHELHGTFPMLSMVNPRGAAEAMEGLAAELEKRLQQQQEQTIRLKKRLQRQRELTDRLKAELKGHRPWWGRFIRSFPSRLRKNVRL
jgi:SAM-dependent methyltransferase